MHLEAHSNDNREAEVIVNALTCSDKIFMTSLILELCLLFRSEVSKEEEVCRLGALGLVCILGAFATICEHLKQST